MVESARTICKLVLVLVLVLVSEKDDRKASWLRNVARPSLE